MFIRGFNDLIKNPQAFSHDKERKIVKFTRVLKTLTDVMNNCEVN